MRKWEPEAIRLIDEKKPRSAQLRGWWGSESLGSGELQTRDRRMLAVFGLPQVVGCLLGEVLACVAEASQFEPVGQVGGYRRTAVQHGGELPARITDVPGQARYRHVDRWQQRPRAMAEDE